MTQISLFEGVRIESDYMYKVKWKAFEEVWTQEFKNGEQHNRLDGFSDTTKIKTTAGLMTITEAESFAKFVSEELYEYAGWHEIVKCKQ